MPKTPKNTQQRVEAVLAPFESPAYLQSQGLGQAEILLIESIASSCSQILFDAENDNERHEHYLIAACTAYLIGRDRALLDH